MIAFFKNLFKNKSFFKPKSKEEILKEIYSIKEIQDYFKDNEKCIKDCKYIREKYFDNDSYILDNISNFALNELGFKISYDECSFGEIDRANSKILFRDIIQGENISFYYKYLLHICFHIYLNHKCPEEFPSIKFNGYYLNHIDKQAYDFACEVLCPIDEILDKIAEMNSLYGICTLCDIDPQLTSYNGIRLHRLKLEKYINLNTDNYIY